MIRLHSNNKKPVVIVTGCSSGLGSSLATQFYLREDLRVIATCRHHSLKELRAKFPTTDRFEVVELDVTEESAIYSFVNNICRLWGRIDVLINNAAVCYRGVVEHMDSDSELVQIKTNYLGPMTLTRAILPIMREQRSGHIINVSSVSGILGMPTMASYSASKHALEGATEALWYESRPFGILVNLIELGFIKSSSYKKVVMAPKAQMSSLLSGPHSEYYHSMVPFIEFLMNHSFSSPEKISRKIISCIDRKNPKLRVLGTPDAVFFNFLKWVFPSHWLHLILYRCLPNSIRWGGLWKVGTNANINK
jgi:NAD(P)-dependent dehydrogenase (short-subunit alcohol dehydrogenase family)